MCFSQVLSFGCLNCMHACSCITKHFWSMFTNNTTQSLNFYIALFMVVCIMPSAAAIPTVTNFRITNIGDTYLTLEWDVSTYIISGSCILPIRVSSSFCTLSIAASSIIFWSVSHLLQESECTAPFN